MLLTWGLLLVWGTLISFGVIAQTSPGWLQQASRQGVDAEAREYKKFGDAALSRRNFGAAITQYQRSLEIKSDQPGVMVNLAAAYTQASIAPAQRANRDGLLAHGAKVLRDALQLETGPGLEAQIRLTLGDILQQQGQLELAIDQYRWAADACVETHLAYRKLGALYLATGAVQQAHQAFARTMKEQFDVGLSYRIMLRRRIERNEDSEEILERLGQQIEDGITIEDLAPFDTGIIRESQRHDPEIAKTHNYVGKAYARQGSTATAIKHYQWSLQIWPRNADAVQAINALRERPQTGQ